MNTVFGKDVYTGAKRLSGRLLSAIKDGRTSEELRKMKLVVRRYRNVMKQYLLENTVEC